MRSGAIARHRSARRISGNMEIGGAARRCNPRSLTSLSLAAECGDVGRVALGTAGKDSGSCDENVCAGVDGKSCGLRCDAAIHFEIDIAPGLADSLRRRFDFPQLAVDEFLD